MGKWALFIIICDTPINIYCFVNLQKNYILNYKKKFKVGIVMMNYCLWLDVKLTTCVSVALEHCYVSQLGTRPDTR